MSKFVEPTELEAKEFMEKQSATSPDSSSRFKEPTPEEVQQFIAKQSGISPSEGDISLANLARAFGEGYTMGGAGEVAGAARATLEGGQEDWYDLYRKKRLEEEQALSAFKEQHPFVAYPTEFAGGVLSPVNKLIAPAIAAKTTLGTLGQAAKTGLASGLITGVGTSEKTLDQPMEYLKDITATGVTGAGLGPIISGLGIAAGRGIPSVLKEIEESSEIGKNLITAFRESSKGKGFIFKSSQERLAKQEEEIAQQFEKVMYGEAGPIQKTTKEVTDFFNAADKAGAKVQLDDELINSFGKIIDSLEKNQLLKYSDMGDIEVAAPSAAALNYFKSIGRTSDIKNVMGSSTLMQIFLDNLNLLKKGEMTPSQAYEFGKWLQGDKNLKNLVTLKGGSMFAEVMEKLPQLSNKLKTMAKESAEEKLGKNSQEIFDKFKDVRSGTVETILNKGKPEDVAQIWQNQYAKDEIKDKLYEDFKEIINKLQDPSSTGDESRNTIRVLQSRIDDLNKKYPDLKLNITDFIDRLKDVASQRTVRNKMITAHGSTASSKDIISKLVDWTGYGGAILAGNIIGRPINAVRQVFSSQLVNAPKEALSPIAGQLKQTKGLEHVGNALDDAINNGSQAAKNAALFMILQNPQASSIAKSYLGAE